MYSFVHFAVPYLFTSRTKFFSQKQLPSNNNELSSNYNNCYLNDKLSDNLKNMKLAELCLNFPPLLEMAENFLRRWKQIQNPFLRVQNLSNVITRKNNGQRLIYIASRRHDIANERYFIRRGQFFSPSPRHRESWLAAELEIKCLVGTKSKLSCNYSGLEGGRTATLNRILLRHW